MSFARRKSVNIAQSMEPWSLGEALMKGAPIDQSLKDEISNKYQYMLSGSDMENPNSGKWEKEDFGKRVLVHTKVAKDLNIYRSEILCPFPLETVVEYVNNQKQRLNNRGRIKTFGFVREINDQIKVEGAHVKGIWPVGDRSMSTYWCEFYDSAENYVQLSWDTPKDEWYRKGCTRVTVEIFGWILKKEDGGTRILNYSEGNAHLGGVPGWVVKKAMGDSMKLPLKITEILEAGLPLEQPKKK
jgi:hypothetical protein